LTRTYPGPTVNNRNPVTFASLDLDDTTAFGPETITVRRSPALGTFVPGEYRYWVHNFTESTFGPSDPTDPTTASNAVVTVLQNGVLVRQFTAASAAGNPQDDIWRVVDLQIDANGTVVLNTIQTFQLGDTLTTF
jgi:hypothetical protein